MKFFLFLLGFVSFSCFSQNESIEITLKSDSTITTNWIKFYPKKLFKEPFIIIHNANGQKIKIKNITQYKGYDQAGNYRYLKTATFGLPENYRYSERVFSHDSTSNINLYYDNLTFGGSDIDLASEYQYINYCIRNSSIKKLSIKNVSNDLSDNLQSKRYINNAKQIRIIQLISIGIGTALLTKTIFKNAVPLNNIFPDNNLDIPFIASGVFLTIPFTLEKTKKKKLIEALKVYE